jgi:DNA processing protein
VIEAIRPSATARVAEPPAPFEPCAAPDEGRRKEIVDLLGPVAVSVDELVRQSNATPAEVQLVLLELDLAGRLDRHAGGRVSLGG